MIERIIAKLPHEDGCASVVRWENDRPHNGPCNCSRREMIAWLERLEEPTDHMIESGMNVYDEDIFVMTGDQWKAMLKAAEDA